MEEYQSILVAIDIYSQYDQILKRALHVVNNVTHLSVVFVTLPTTYFQPYISNVDGDYVADIHKQAKNRLDEIAEKITSQPNRYIYPLAMWLRKFIP